MFKDWKKLYYYILAVYFIVPFVLFFQLFGRRSSIIAVCYPDFPYLNNIVLETEEVNDLLVRYKVMLRLIIIHLAQSRHSCVGYRCWFSIFRRLNQHNNVSWILASRKSWRKHEKNRPRLCQGML
jgi:hypothetical protein